MSDSSAPASGSPPTRRVVVDEVVNVVPIANQPHRQAAPGFGLTEDCALRVGLF
ncbi:hypothetical protein IU470_18780 [Nocardia abscessus]|uniref:Uncharacterized protein n=1 Tax=Nocardia abscessus TaxID=120957 RepID=A0ABS0C9U2_9NOCA|nr:hypothetical protein [Nocardia abscessus]MBF6227142.1 hypothetical protein [Nocardia abscessus]